MTAQTTLSACTCKFSHKRMRKPQGLRATYISESTHSFLCALVATRPEPHAKCNARTSVLNLRSLASGFRRSQSSLTISALLVWHFRLSGYLRMRNGRRRKAPPSINSTAVLTYQFQAMQWCFLRRDEGIRFSWLRCVVHYRKSSALQAKFVYVFIYLNIFFFVSLLPHTSLAVFRAAIFPIDFILWR